MALDPILITHSGIESLVPDFYEVLGVRADIPGASDACPESGRFGDLRSQRFVTLSVFALIEATHDGEEVIARSWTAKVNFDDVAPRVRAIPTHRRM